jgi:hypothetical protein
LKTDAAPAETADGKTKDAGETGDSLPWRRAGTREDKSAAADAGESDARNLLIDLVLVVLDASSKDLTTPCDLINDVLLPCLGEENKHRILIGLNQADMAMKGRHWDYEENKPDSVLEDFLKEKAASVKSRILDTTGVEVEPIYYCAGYTEDDGTQRQPYNLTKLFYSILMAIPSEKRLALAGNLNEDERVWADDDKEMDYKEEIKKGFFEGVPDCIGEGAEKGAVTGGCILGIPGMVVGGLIGAILGGLSGLIVKPLTSDAALGTAVAVTVQRYPICVIARNEVTRQSGANVVFLTYFPST